MTHRIGVFAVLGLVCAVLAGCAGLTGFPVAEGQLRVFEGDAAIAGGNLVTPARGQGAGHGCIVSQVGTVDAELTYTGEKCVVHAPCGGCGATEAGDVAAVPAPAAAVELDDAAGVWPMAAPAAPESPCVAFAVRVRALAALDPRAREALPSRLVDAGAPPAQVRLALRALAYVQASGDDVATLWASALDQCGGTPT